METFYGGNCLFDDRPLYLAVRTEQYKYFWKEYRDHNDWQSADGNELYDLRDDPREVNNLYRPDHPLIEGFETIIGRRLAELPEIDDDRLRRVMGDRVAAKILTATAAE